MSTQKDATVKQMQMLDVGPLVAGFLYHTHAPSIGPSTEDAACEGEASSGGESRTTDANGDQPHSQVRAGVTRAAASSVERPQHPSL
jgi:hypothetical protein